MKDSEKGNYSPSPKKPSSVSVREIRSEDLLQGTREILILHGDSRYRLQVTKAGKLILIK